MGSASCLSCPRLREALARANGSKDGMAPCDGFEPALDGSRYAISSDQSDQYNYYCHVTNQQPSNSQSNSAAICHTDHDSRLLTI